MLETIQPFVYPDKKPGWCVYMVQAKDGTFYCGVTNDIENRINAHNGLVRGGAKFTNNTMKRPVRLVYIEYPEADHPALQKQVAMQREYVIKKFRRPAKIELIMLPTNKALASNYDD